jgi:hypothetical protein
MIIKVLAAAAALLASVAFPASAKMVCHDEPDTSGAINQPPTHQVCVDKEAGAANWIILYCRDHPADPECVARGYHYNSTDPIEQKIDQRLVDRHCAGAYASTTFSCLSPFEFWKLHPEQRPD